MKLHSYKKAAYKCEDCEFIGESQFTMDVHIGKLHSEQIECGICECVTKTLEDLEVHLSGCEVYKCASNDDLDCVFQFKTLSEIRNHIKSEHKWGHFKHIKLKRNDQNEVKLTKYWFDGEQMEKEN